MPSYTQLTLNLIASKEAGWLVARLQLQTDGQASRSSGKGGRKLQLRDPRAPERWAFARAHSFGDKQPQHRGEGNLRALEVQRESADARVRDERLRARYSEGKGR